MTNAFLNFVICFEIFGFVVIVILGILTFFNYRECDKIKEEMRKDEERFKQQLEDLRKYQRELLKN